MDINQYNFYVGSTRGTLIFNCEVPNKLQSAKAEEVSEITALVFGRNESELLVGYENGLVNRYNITEKTYGKIPRLEGEGRVIGIACVDKSLIVGKHDGVINIYNAKNLDYFDIHLDEKGTLDTLVYNDNRHGIFGTGGEFNDFKLWDVETHQCIFKAKSLGHDMLNLPIPTSVRGITFFPESPYLNACATKEGHILLYDDRAQRRPVVKFLERKFSYTSIACAYRESQCLVGTTRGYMQVLDMKVGKCLRTFTSFTGSVTSIVSDPVQPYVFSTSLDRHLRVHNLETKELLHKIYMKQNLTKIVLKPVVKDEPTENLTNESNIDDEYEEIFKNMQTVISDKKLKKQKRKIEEVPVKSKKNRKKNIKEAEH